MCREERAKAGWSGAEGRRGGSRRAWGQTSKGEAVLRLELGVKREGAEFSP